MVQVCPPRWSGHVHPRATNRHDGIRVVSVGCGTEPSSASTDAGDRPDAPADVAETVGCTSNADCPDGGWCVGPSGCDAVWTCVDEVPCSAAAPFDACACDGVFRSLSAGCPGQKYGWSTWVPEYRLGTTCDPTAPTQWADVTARIGGLDAPDGAAVGGALRDGVAGADCPPPRQDQASPRTSALARA